MSRKISSWPRCNVCFRVWEPDCAVAAASNVTMSQEALLGGREGLASQLLSRRSIGHVFSLGRGKRRRLSNRSTQSESLDYHTIHNRASLRALLLSASKQYQLNRIWT